MNGDSFSRYLVNTIYPKIEHLDFRLPTKEEIGKYTTKNKEGKSKNEDITKYLPGLPNLYDGKTIKRRRKLEKSKTKSGEKSSKKFIHPYFLFEESKLHPIVEKIDPTKSYDNINMEEIKFDFDKDLRIRSVFRLGKGKYKPFRVKSNKSGKKRKRDKNDKKGNPSKKLKTIKLKATGSGLKIQTIK